MQTMLDLHKQLAASKAEHERNHLQRQMEATDRQIDALVFELYGLTEEEIRIVEGRIINFNKTRRSAKSI